MSNARVERREVIISDRASAKLGEERDLQRALKPHDIRRSIPLVSWTDPAAFPPYSFREWPKMPLLDGNAPIQIDASGTLLMFHDAADEQEFLEANPELADEIERNSPAKQFASAIAAKDEELSELRRRLMEAGINPDVRKPKSGPVGLAGLVRTEVATLRDQVQAAEEAATVLPAGVDEAPAKPKNPLKAKKAG